MLLIMNNNNIIYDILRKIPLSTRKRTATDLLCSSRKFKYAKIIIDEINSNYQITPILVKFKDCLFLNNELLVNTDDCISLKSKKYPHWVFKEYTINLNTEIKDVPHYWESNVYIKCNIVNTTCIKLLLNYQYDNPNYHKLPIWYNQYKINYLGMYNLKIINNILTHDEDIMITYDIYQHDERTEYFSLIINLEIFQNKSSCNVILSCSRTFSFVFKNNKIYWERKVNDILYVPPQIEDLNKIKTKSGWTTMYYNDKTKCKLLDYNNNNNYVLKLPCNEISRLLL